MGTSSKIAIQSKFGITGSKKKVAINYWRFFFNALNKDTAAEQMFYLEFEMLNPSLSPETTILGFKPRVTVTAEDLQYALAGTQSAQNLQTEAILEPSYCVIRFGKFGKNGKQLCTYFPLKDLTINQKPYEVIFGDKFFSDDKLSGSINISKSDLTDYPELMCDAGSAVWDLHYVINKENGNGYTSKTGRWFPNGLNTTFTGSITFDDTEYVVDPSRSYGYIERMWGKSVVEPWFHISSSNLISNISGKQLQGASFAVQGVFDGHVSFIANIDDTEIIFAQDSSNKYNDIWQCTQMPEVEEVDENKIHWSVSINNKAWIIDIDIFCKINELSNRNIELPEGKRKVLSLIEGGNGTGEIKIYKKVKNDLEQIEFAKINNCICEFGHNEEADL